jgi:hypothetical protein
MNTILNKFIKNKEQRTERQKIDQNLIKIVIEILFNNWFYVLSDISWLLIGRKDIRKYINKCQIESSIHQ